MSGSAAGWAPTHVAFLRAINVGGRRLKMDELVAACAPLGLGEIRTWQATGNLVFASSLDARALEEQLPGAFEAELGLHVPCVVRTVDEVRSAVDNPPFTAEAIAATAGKLQTCFVRDTPDAATQAAVLGYATDDDPLTFDAGALWWLPRAGISTSALAFRKIERLLGVCTMRTHGALAGLAAKHLR